MTKLIIEFDEFTTIAELNKFTNDLDKWLYKNSSLNAIISNIKLVEVEEQCAINKAIKYY